jgi:uncharacterized Fe-S cluster-containing radical SAM superfamily protein
MTDIKCVLPFINRDYQSNSPCCLLKNGYDDAKDQKELLEAHNSNNKSKFCESCWKTESTGIESKRQQYNRLYKKYIDQTHRDIKLNVIPVGNICNLSCIVCGPFSSTGWIKKHNFLHNENVKFNINKDIKITDLADINTVDHVEFIGGETLQSRSFWEYLKTIKKTISFSIQTNGTIVLTQEQIKLLSSFNNFNICFSIDGYDSIFEYLRQPAKWESTLKNIKKYAELFGKNKLSYYITVSNLNIFYIDKIILELFKILPVSHMLNLVHGPVKFSYNNLPIEIGKIVQKHNPVFFKKNKINWIGTKNSLQKLLENLEKQDEFIGLKFSDSLPELYQLINDFVKK